MNYDARNHSLKFRNSVW